MYCYMLIILQYGVSCLIWAVRNYHTSIIAILLQNNVNVDDVDMVIIRNCFKFCVTFAQKGYSALHWACRRKDLDTFKKLLRHGAACHLKNEVFSIFNSF